MEWKNFIDRGKNRLQMENTLKLKSLSTLAFGNKTHCFLSYQYAKNIYGYIKVA